MATTIKNYLPLLIKINRVLYYLVLSTMRPFVQITIDNLYIGNTTKSDWCETLKTGVQTKYEPQGIERGYRAQNGWPGFTGAEKN